MALREKLEQIRSNPRPTNEEAAKFQILAPILAELGWDPFGLEILWEHSVGATKGGGRVDIALKAEGSIRALIEAKAPGAQLSQHVDQVLMYAYREGVDICVLTDGLQWWLYLPREKGEPEKRRFAVLNVDRDPVEQLCDDLNNFLGREALRSGHAERRAEQVLKALREAQKLEEKMPAIWQRMLDEPDNELVELMGQRVYDKLSLRPEREQIVAAMRKMPIPARTPETPRIQEPAPPTASNPTAVVLWGKRHPIRRHSDILMTVAEELYNRHPNRFDETVEPLKFREWQYVSRDRRRVAGKNPRQTPSGYFVNVHMSAERHRRRWTRLLEAFGHSGSDLQLLYEDTRPEKPSGRRRTRRPSAIRLWDERHPVRTHADILMTVVEQLHRRHLHEFDRAVEPLRRGEFQYVSRDPGRVRGTRLKQAPSGHYVDINLSAEDIKKRVVQLLEALGHRNSDLEYLYKG